MDHAAVTPHAVHFSSNSKKKVAKNLFVPVSVRVSNTGCCGVAAVAVAASAAAAALP